MRFEPIMHQNHMIHMHLSFNYSNVHKNKNDLTRISYSHVIVLL